MTDYKELWEKLKQYITQEIKDSDGTGAFSEFDMEFIYLMAMNNVWREITRLEQEDTK